MYLNYATHVYAYLNLATGPFPAFLGEPGYDVDVEFAPPARQNRWTVVFRIILAIPALMLGGVLGGGIGGSFSSGATTYGLQASGILSACALLTWFYAMFTGRAPEGVTRLQYFCLHYTAQLGAYALLMTDRYPTSDPERVGVPWPPREHPIRIRAQADDGTRSRVTVFFRLLLAFPHFVWLALWGVVAMLAALVNWVVTVIRGRASETLHDFLASFIRYQTHLAAFLSLTASPFPGFTGREESYPVDLWIAPPERQGRWGAAFRIILAVPAFILNSSLNLALYLVAIFGWFVALFTGRMPVGLRRLGLFALRYAAQTNAYVLLLTSRYPYAGPPA
jgi:hypothetical protein